MAGLFDRTTLGDLDLANRIVMAPMTRSRADQRGVINPTASEYYAARTSAGLIISEGINVGPMSNAFDRTPGLWTEEQTEGWKAVVDRIHEKGGALSRNSGTLDARARVACCPTSNRCRRRA